MIFSMDTIRSSLDKSLKESKIENFDIDYSPIKESVSSIHEESFADALGKAMTSRESMKTFETNIFDIFQWTIENMSSTYNKYSSYIDEFNKKYGDDIKGYQKSLSNADKPITYTKSYFVFKNLYNGINKASFDKEVDTVFKDLSSDLSKIRKCKSTTDRSDLMYKLRGDCENISKSYDKLRADIVCSTSGVSSADYLDELYQYFRVAENFDLFENNISPLRIRQATNEIKNMKSNSNSLKRECTKITNKCNSYTINKLDALMDYDKTATNEAISIEYIYMIAVNKAERRLKEICRAFTLYYSSKIAAIKDSNKLNKDIMAIASKDYDKEANKDE